MTLRLTPIYSYALRQQTQFAHDGAWRVARSYGDVEREGHAARHAVALADESSRARVLVEGEEAEALLQHALDAPMLAINAGVRIADAYLYRLRHDLFCIRTNANGEAALVARLNDLARERAYFVTVTDMTDAWGELRLVGPRCREVLSQLCALDFAPNAFANYAAKQTSLAKTTQLIVRCDIGALPAFALIGARSFTAYVWDTLLHAGHAYGIAPVGTEAMGALLGAEKSGT
ncbi:MAG: hypothetical protein LC737_04810 [Chloroflexi bacterium]|nr:hypothetical protein [Chloroflexota bacterium]